MRHGEDRATAAPEQVAERINEYLVRARGEQLAQGPDGLVVLKVPKEHLLVFMSDLRDDELLQFKIPLDVTAIDNYGEEPRFEVVYHLYSIALKMRLRVKTTCSDRDKVVPSVVDVYPGANYHERETFDMFGIRFDGHPDLRRILMPLEFEHHPLLKDFPLEGIEPEKQYRLGGGPMMPRPKGAEPFPGAGSTTP